MRRKRSMHEHRCIVVWQSGNQAVEDRRQFGRLATDVGAVVGHAHRATLDSSGGHRSKRRWIGHERALLDRLLVEFAQRFRNWDLVGPKVVVLMPGGDALVDLAGPLTLTGPATHIADFEVPDA